MPLNWTPPLPPNGVASTPATDTARQAAVFFGEDIWLDVTAGEGADLLVTPAGDWAVVGGIEALKQSLMRRLITNPGEWRTKPEYGVGARRFLKARDVASVRSDLVAKIREQFLLDPRVERVDEILIEKTRDERGAALLRVGVKFTPRGRLRVGDRTEVVQIDLR